jgi:glycosyltransferase involved in cell wall biosynthesis
MPAPQSVSRARPADLLVPEKARKMQSLQAAPTVEAPPTLRAASTSNTAAGDPLVPTLAPMGVRVSVIIPALNEEENLPYVFARLPQGLHELIVVDGDSTDDTVAAARRLRPDVRIVTQTGHGKGNALADGFAACTGDIVVTLDADGSTDAAEIPRFVAALLHGADFVKGSRFAQGGASSDITLMRRVGNQALNALVNSLYGTSYTDLCYGYNAFWARCLPYMRVDCNGFEVETLINVRIAKAGLVIHEVPSYERDRMHGRSNLHAVRDGIRVLRTIALERISASSLYRIARRRMAG